MPTARIDLRATLARSLVKAGSLVQHPFVLVDVGASAGIARCWRVFEPSLVAIGFDPLVKECERLNREEANARVRYFDYYVGCERYDQLLSPAITSDARAGWSNQPFPRTSAARAQEMMSMPADQLYNNGDPEVRYTHKRTSLDRFFQHYGEPVDFIKVDTDGHDYEVLCGAEQVIERDQVLGLLVECQFHGIAHAHSNLFANIDRFLRERGFSLFDLDVYRYTRRLLPGRFVHNLAAQTESGQVLAADVLYLRDLAAPGYEARWDVELSSWKVLKLASLMELFGMSDCAAEVVYTFRDRVANILNVDAAIDQFAKQALPGVSSFQDLNDLFSSSLNRFYPRRPMEVLRRRLPAPLKRVLRKAHLKMAR